MASEEFSGELEFLNSLFTTQNPTFDMDLMNQIDQLEMNNPLEKTANMDIKNEKQNLEAEKVECEQLRNQISENMQALAKAEKELEGLENRKMKLKTDLQCASDKVSAAEQELHHLKRLQKPGSGDMRKVELKGNILQFYENLMKMKLVDTSYLQDKPKNFVQGYIYNINNMHLKHFYIPIQQNIGWDFLAPASHLSWTANDSIDEENDEPVKWF
uniref:Uncharacterized protein n=1 Tax=Cacopsylla melanoneura TaxID=428564 RepID=A0A8D8YNQ8_9HEMI